MLRLTWLLSLVCSTLISNWTQVGDEQVFSLLYSHLIHKDDQAAYNLVFQLTSVHNDDRYVKEAMRLAILYDRAHLFQVLGEWIQGFPLDIVIGSLPHCKDTRTLKAIVSVYLRLVPEGSLFDNFELELSRSFYSHPLGGLDRMWKFSRHFKHPTGCSLLLMEILSADGHYADADRFARLSGLDGTFKPFVRNKVTFWNRIQQRMSMMAAIRGDKGRVVRTHLAQTDPILMPDYVKYAIEQESYHALIVLLRHYPITGWSVAGLFTGFKGFTCRIKNIIFRALHAKSECINWIGLSIIPFDRELFKLLIATPDFVPNQMDILLSLSVILDNTAWHYSIQFIDRFKHLFDKPSRKLITSWFIRQNHLMEIVRFWEGLESRLELDEINNVLTLATPILVQLRKEDPSGRIHAETVIHKLRKMVDSRQQVKAPAS